MCNGVKGIEVRITNAEIRLAYMNESSKWLLRFFLQAMPGADREEEGNLPTDYHSYLKLFSVEILHKILYYIQGYFVTCFNYPRQST